MRPWKPELPTYELARYRSVYCRLCKTLGEQYGQMLRPAVTYELTFFMLFLGGLLDDERLDDGEAERCVLHPIKKHPIAARHPLYDLGADLSVLLLGAKVKDDIADGNHRIRSMILSRLFKQPLKRAEARQLLSAQGTTRILTELDDIENPGNARTAEGEAARKFAELLELYVDAAFEYLAAIELTLPESRVRAAARLMVGELGEWIYLLDALADLETDYERGEYNVWTEYDSRDEALVAAESKLTSLEASINRTAAILPWKRHAVLMRNIIQHGLPEMRSRVGAGEKPWPV